MKTLVFNVNKQKLSKKPSIVFSTLRMGSNDEYDARFEFSKEWDEVTKFVKFGFGSIEEYIPLIKNTCRIPDRITKLSKFYVEVTGVSNTSQMKTNSVVVKQKRSK